MRRHRGIAASTCGLAAVLLLTASFRIRAQDRPSDLRSVIEQQGKEIEALQKQLEAKIAARATAEVQEPSQQVDANAV